MKNPWLLLPLFLAHLCLGDENDFHLSPHSHILDRLVHEHHHTSTTANSYIPSTATAAAARPAAVTAAATAPTTTAAAATAPTTTAAAATAPT
eukprot:Lankesteria_metandrocarpae@DN3252_c0_g1_i2.p1